MVINIIFDADDTLWQTEELYEKARQETVAIMVGKQLGQEAEIVRLTRDIDNRNFDKFGFSKERFPKSLVATYHELCKKNGWKEDPEVAEHIQAIGARVFTSKATLIPGVKETLEDLHRRGCKLYLWTQGDSEVQNRRIDESGLRDFFSNIRIVAKKSANSLHEIIGDFNMAGHAREHEWWVVGNSIKSDINPAVEADLKAIWIPANVWDREKERLRNHRDDQVYGADKINVISDIILPTENQQKIINEVSNGKIVYLFVSAYHDLYRQYVLDILAYPRNLVFKFPYDIRWLPEPYRDRSEDFAKMLAGKRALVVFVDERMEGEPIRAQYFLPIREAKIMPDVDKVKVGGGMLHIEFMLGNYVDYGQHEDQRRQGLKKYDQTLKTLAARPSLRRNESAYITIGPNFLIKSQRQRTLK